MRCEEFVSVLAELSPMWREQMKIAGVSDEDAEDQIRSMVIPPRATASSQPVDDEVLRLIAHYDCSKVVLPGDISFQGQPMTGLYGTIVATEESDPIRVVSSGELVLFDHVVPDFVTARCSLNGACFLEAMAILMRAQANHPQKPKTTTLVLAGCTEAAGGDTYESYWRAKVSLLFTSSSA